MTSMKMSTKILGVFLLTFVVGIGVILYLNMRMYDLTSTFNGIIHGDLHYAEAARGLELTFKDENHQWKNLLLRGGDPKDLQAYTSAFESLDAKVRSQAQSLASEMDRADLRKLVDNFTTAEESWHADMERALAEFKADGGHNPVQTDRSVKGLDEKPTKLVEELSSRLDSEAQAKISDTEASNKQDIMISDIISFGLYAVIVILAVLLIRAVTRRIHKAIDGLSMASEQVSDAAQQVAEASQGQAAGASEHAAGLEETSSTMEQMATMVRQNADAAKDANSMAEQAKGSAEEGSTAMNYMGSAIAAIKSASDDTAKIIKTIDEIAFQTNLLALNAAVEAARAGDAGRGFAVVADEVRTLAQRSAVAAKDTSDLIVSSQEKADQGVGAAQKVEAALQEVNGQINQMVELLRQVADASREQAQGIEQINQTVSQMDEITQRNASGAEETSAASEELSSLAVQVNALVGDLERLVNGQSRYLAAQQAALPAGKSNGGSNGDHHEVPWHGEHASLPAPDEEHAET